MTSLNLSPKDQNYLTSNLVFNQLTQNSIEIELNEDNCTPVVTPKLLLDGSGRAYLTGSFTLENSAQQSGSLFFTLPKTINIENDTLINAITYGSADNPNSYSFGIKLLKSSSGVESVDVTSEGYTYGAPSIISTGPGGGATFVFTTEFYGNVNLLTNPTGNTSYAPGDTITIAGGTYTEQAVMEVGSTYVYAASIVSGGSGGIDGNKIADGTTGTGTKFRIAVTVSGGSITSIDGFISNGSYTVNPTDLSHEPVTTNAGSLFGAVFAVYMAPATFLPHTNGSYTSFPANPASQDSSSGSGVGITFSLAWKIDSISVVNSGLGYTDETLFSVNADSPPTISVTLTDPIDQICGINYSNIDENVSLDGSLFFVNS